MILDMSRLRQMPARHLAIARARQHNEDDYISGILLQNTATEILAIY
jgi:hypothetical protein